MTNYHNEHNEPQWTTTDHSKLYRTDGDDDVKNEKQTSVFAVVFTVHFLSSVSFDFAVVDITVRSLYRSSSSVHLLRHLLRHRGPLQPCCGQSVARCNPL